MPWMTCRRYIFDSPSNDGQFIQRTSDNDITQQLAWLPVTALTYAGLLCTSNLRPNGTCQDKFLHHVAFKATEPLTSSVVFLCNDTTHTMVPTHLSHVLSTNRVRMNMEGRKISEQDGIAALHQTWPPKIRELPVVLLNNVDITVSVATQIRHLPTHHLHS